MTKRLIVSLAAALLATGAMAGGGYDVSDKTTYWGASSAEVTTNLDHALDDVCIGKHSCAKWGDNSFYRNDKYTDEYSKLVFGAVQVENGGLKLCPLQLEAPNTKKQGAWTEYLLPASEAECVWLCKEGYTGPNCEFFVSDYGTYKPKSCDSTLLVKEKYSNMTFVKNGGNVEDSIPMFSFNQKILCGSKHATGEWDVLLLLRNWLPSGHGAKVQLTAVGAWNEGYRSNKSTPVLAELPTSGSVLVCKNGYMPNEDKTDCIAIDEVICGEKKICPGYDWDKYDESQHILAISETTPECYEFRCAGQNTAFDATNMAEFKCVQINVAENISGGIDPETGISVVCAIGEIFDRETATCKSTVGYSKSDLRYGKGNTKDSNKKLDEQCWTKSTVDDYKACVFGTESQVNDWRTGYVYER